MLIHRVSSDVAESETQLSTEITGGIKTFQRQFIALSLFFNQIFQTLFIETALHPLLKRANSRSEYVKNWRDRHIRNETSATEPGKDAVHFVQLLKI